MRRQAACVAALLAAIPITLRAQAAWLPSFAWPAIDRSLPTYDRTDGLSLPLAVRFGGDSGLSVRPSLTYRSQLGRVDPAISLSRDAGAGVVLDAWVGRSTFAADSWISSDLVNSTETLLFGADARDYYRAVSERVTGGWRFNRGGLRLEPYIGEQAEAPRSVRPDTGATSGPWALFGRHNANDMLRPNPDVSPHAIVSALGGARFQWQAGDVVTGADLNEEVGMPTSVDCVACNGRMSDGFAQITADGAIAFPTFGAQRVRMRAHAVFSGSNTPAQRLVHLGGVGTLPTIPMLALSGEHLAFLDANYDLPLTPVLVPVLGEPTLTLREILGGVSYRGFPALTQLEGLRLSAGVVYIEGLVDTHTRAAHLSLGVDAAP